MGRVRQRVKQVKIDREGGGKVVGLTSQGISTQGFFSCSEAQKYICPYMNVKEDNNIGKSSKEVQEIKWQKVVSLSESNSTTISDSGPVHAVLPHNTKQQANG